LASGRAPIIAVLALSDGNKRSSLEMFGSLIKIEALSANCSIADSDHSLFCAHNRHDFAPRVAGSRH
jgi:hypothetical protein